MKQISKIGIVATLLLFSQLTIAQNKIIVTGFDAADDVVEMAVNSVRFSSVRKTGTVTDNQLSKQIFVIRKPIDRFSQILVLAQIKGRIFPRVFVVMETSAKQMLEYELKNVSITSYTIAGSSIAGSTPAPVEEIVLSFKSIGIVYSFNQ